MIQANELRFGNWFKGIYGKHIVFTIYIERGEHLVSYVNNEFSSKHDGIIKLKDCKPIPLTPEILEKCGFKRYNNSFVLPEYRVADYIKWHFTIWNPKGDDTYKYNSAEFDVELKSLHQLQNLYFSLTGAELIVQMTESIVDK